MEILLILLIGVVVGIVVKFFRLGLESEGTLVTIGLGLAGAIVGGLIGRALWAREPFAGFGLVAAAAGALIFIVVYTFVDRRRALSS